VPSELVPATVVARLVRAGLTVATAESLTGGLVAAALTSVPGSSAVVRGGVVAYATDLKAALLGVEAALLARVGAVHPDVAAAMARGAAERLGADLGIACTGVAGPDPQDGQPPGTVFVAAYVAAERRTVVRAEQLAGDRDAVRRATVASAMALIAEVSGAWA
jgi:nicotinamide-nucleotide amidase